jgi:hypothetical protein
MKTGCGILAAAVLSFGQTPAKKETAPAAEKTVAAVKPDTWQRSRECSAQADKIRGRKDGLLVDYEKSVDDLVATLSAIQTIDAALVAAKSGKAAPAVPITLEKGLVNHYSPKHGTCFLQATYVLMNVGARAGAPLDRTTSVLLIDAFEGGLAAHLDFSICFIGGEPSDCADAKSTIGDAMSN